MSFAKAGSERDPLFLFGIDLNNSKPTFPVEQILFLLKLFLLHQNNKL